MVVPLNHVPKLELDNNFLDTAKGATTLVPRSRSFSGEEVEKDVSLALATNDSPGKKLALRIPAAPSNSAISSGQGPKRKLSLRRSPKKIQKMQHARSCLNSSGSFDIANIFDSGFITRPVSDDTPTPRTKELMTMSLLET